MVVSYAGGMKSCKSGFQRIMPLEKELGENEVFKQANSCGERKKNAWGKEGKDLIEIRCRRYTILSINIPILRDEY